MIWWFLTWGWRDLQKLCTFNSKLTAVAVCDRNHVAWMIIYSVLHWQACSLHSRCSLPLIRNAYKAALRCFFWGDQQTQLIYQKSVLNFLSTWLTNRTCESWHVLKSKYTCSSPEKGYWHCLTDRLKQEFGFVCGTGYDWVFFCFFSPRYGWHSLLLRWLTGP